MSSDLSGHFHDMALSMFVAYKALLFNETPVACIVKNTKTGEVTSIGYNYTNTSLNGTQHAEFIAMQRFKDQDVNYKDLVVYVTVEPCIMCASFLRQLGIGKVYYGCGNDRFGGTGTVLSVHDDPNLGEGRYESIGGIMRTEGIQLLRNFYIQENESAPQPKIKKNKEIETKEFPRNEFKFSEDQFIENYGKERIPLYNDGVKELTPVFGKGYSVHDLIDISSVKALPYLEQELGEITQDQLNEFCDLFFNIHDNGEINYDKPIRKYNAKKRHLEE
ncbi:uncharacterized protein SPAPADRAFT_137171 [Spathaspora passalidarum NRRL Y-27907]|uniref:CMP/dCMP-type deaminase domain-containing protein n=1 Tax=Spathaspora passalidarum (strain NRRL Y-27907 / 11-Y1) TaxID=619300 RepID=G3AMS0_SPAPN|nr:uncharacterized protein SPAPADRAFT_137171 [Spathaspora passalidarum NRRL Y-27907]EGW33514.1 hypothetical protein SPAPADRAFT_137171 [Spathaspora passalidarum NRRL Y-27907]